jgi:hypothetical protein
MVLALRSHPSRSLLSVGSALLCLALLGAVTVSAGDKEKGAGSAEMDELWVEPTDLESRDLFWGRGGRAVIPRSDVDYEFVKMDTQGHSDGYEVDDPEGRRWKVKVGEEAQPEIVVSRVLWAIGYHQPVLHYLKSWRLKNGPTPKEAAGRFRLEADHEKKGDWSWRKNPFAGTRQLRGLVVANLVLNNWDLEPDNNRIYEPKDAAGGPKRWFVVQDVGGALGRSFFPTGTRNKIEDFEGQDLLEKGVGGKLRFDYKSYHRNLVSDVSPNDVVWACRLLARLSDQQLADAFRAADYPPEIAARYIRKIQQKIQQGLALEATAGRTGG